MLGCIDAEERGVCERANAVYGNRAALIGCPNGGFGFLGWREEWHVKARMKNVRRVSWKVCSSSGGVRGLVAGWLGLRPRCWCMRTWAVQRGSLHTAVE